MGNEHATWKLRPGTRPEDECYIAVASKTGNVLAYVQVFPDKSAGYWFEPQQQAKPARDRVQAELQALLPIADALRKLDVHDAVEVRLYLQGASAHTGAAELRVALKAAAHAHPTMIAFANGREVLVEEPAITQLRQAGACETTLDEYEDFVSGQHTDR